MRGARECGGVPYLLRISALDDQTVWIIGQDHNHLDRSVVVLHTADGGATWAIQDACLNAPFSGVFFVWTGG